MTSNLFLHTISCRIPNVCPELPRVLYLLGPFGFKKIIYFSNCYSILSCYLRKSTKLLSASHLIYSPFFCFYSKFCYLMWKYFPLNPGITAHWGTGLTNGLLMLRLVDSRRGHNISLPAGVSFLHQDYNQKSVATRLFTMLAWNRSHTLAEK